MKKTFNTKLIALKLGKAVSVIMLSTILLVSCKKDETTPPGGYPGKPAPIDATVVRGSGDISSQLADFRKLLGDSLNTTLPANPAGRREVNWDGVPANFSDPNAFPADFFNAIDPAIAAGRKRGLLYANNDSSLRVTTKAFIDIDSSYPSQFTPFSPPRVFSRLGSNVTEVIFKVPGTLTAASVKGMGVVFIDVDDANSTFIEYYDGNKSLGEYKAPVRTATSAVSFLGVFFPGEKITRVKITSGNGILGKGLKDVSNGGSKDLVVMDDFFYTEPKGL